MAKFSGKTALVTGAGSGIGHCISLQLAREGAYIVVVDLDKNAANLTLSKITANGGSGEILVCDISNNSDVTAFVKDLLEHRTIDILINNAGIAHIGNVENTTEADLDRIYSVNVKGVYNMLSAVVPAMKTRRHGVIINMASVGGQWGGHKQVHYAASKSGLINLTRSLSRLYSSHGITVNTISPGLVESKMAKKEILSDDGKEKIKNIPIGRTATPEEIASSVLFLCSSDSSYITGHTLNVNGGMFFN